MGFIRTYARVLGLLAGDRQVAIGIGVASVVLAGVQFLEPLLFGRVIDLLARASGLDQASLWTQAILLLAIWGVVGLVGIGLSVATALGADRMAHRNRLGLMHRYFEHVLALPLSFHGDTQSGRLMKIMLVGADNLFFLWLSFFREHLVTFIACLVLLPLTLLLNWKLALLLIVLVALFCAVSGYVVTKTQKAQEQVEWLHTKMAGTAQDALSNVMVVQSFTRLSAESRLFRDITRQVLDHQFPVLNWWAVVAVLTRSASTICVIAIFVLGTVLHLQGEAGVGDIVTFMGFATMLIARLEGAVGFVSRLVFQRPSIEEMFAVLDATSSVPEAPDAKVIERAKGEVRFEGVGFAYPGGPPVLSDISFASGPGRTVALVGHTGAGKTTAMALLQRLWDPTEGRITLDGHDLRELSLESLRRNIGVVFQDAMLFNRSIRDNLLVGRPDATDAEIEMACKLAQAWDFIQATPNGLDTLVGERGATLSGGQKQRLSIARALLKDPPVLILDEATSALDAATEARVQQALKALMAGRTTFIIAHRLSTVKDADEILVFEGGRIVERGDYATLLRQGGRFGELVRTQLTGEGPAQATAAD
jgi:ATP-binding cassette subfamily B protein